MKPGRIQTRSKQFRCKHQNSPLHCYIWITFNSQCLTWIILWTHTQKDYLEAFIFSVETVSSCNCAKLNRLWHSGWDQYITIQELGTKQNHLYVNMEASQWIFGPHSLWNQLYVLLYLLFSLNILELILLEFLTVWWGTKHVLNRHSINRL